MVWRKLRCRAVVPLTVVLVLASACTHLRHEQTAAAEVPHATHQDLPVLMGRYTGVLLCADCPGIRTELSLYVQGAFREPATYVLRETYLESGNGDLSFTTTGRWTIRRGSTADPNATVYQLNFDRPDQIRNFLKVGDKELRMLDGALGELPPSLPRTLMRQKFENNVKR